MASDERIPAKSGWAGQRCLGVSRLAAAVMGLSLVVAAPAASAGDGARPGKGGGAWAAPRYRFEEGKRYVYEVRIEATTPDGLEVTSGHSHYTVKAVDPDSGNMTLSNFGSLSTRRGGRAKGDSPIFVPFSHKNWDSPRFGPFANPETNYGLAREIVVDPLGNVIKTSGHAYLPALLGDLGELVLDPLPPEGKRTWQRQNEVLVVSKHAGFWWAAPFLAGREVSRSARQTTKYALGKAASGVVTIEKRYELATEEKVGEKPFLAQVGEGQIEFDLAAGVPKRMEMEFTITVQREQRQTKIPGSVSVRLLDEAEAEKLAQRREAALAAAREAARPKELDEAALGAALADLGTGERHKMLAALNRLANALPVEARRQEVAAALEPLLESPESFVPGAAAKALGVWGNEASVPALVATLESGDTLRKIAVMDALAKLKDPRGAEAVAGQVSPMQTRAAAIKALEEMGPMAEGAVLPLLEDGDWAVEVTACQILGKIGTQKSAAALEKAQAASNRAVAAEAKRALEAIGKRQQ